MPHAVAGVAGGAFACGATFVEPLTEARGRTAAALLRHTVMPIAEVAHASGYEDLSAFFRAFRRRTGLTPRVYRLTTETPLLAPR